MSQTISLFSDFQLYYPKLYVSEAYLLVPEKCCFYMAGLLALRKIPSLEDQSTPTNKGQSRAIAVHLLSALGDGHTTFPTPKK